MLPMEGRLHKYFTSPALTAFESGDLSSDSLLLFIGGLTDGYLTVGFIPALAEWCNSRNWAFAQVNLSSSYGGYGVGGLDGDVEEIERCVKYFGHDVGKRRIVLVGHSTGCQDIIHLLLTKGGKLPEVLKGVVLQAPVSDREYIASQMQQEVYDGYVELARTMKAVEDGQEIMPRKVCDVIGGAPITADRFWSLAAKGGQDDYFSSDLEKDERPWSRLPKNMPLLAVYSDEDEYVGEHVDKQMLLDTWKKDCPSDATFVLLPRARHDISEEGSVQVTAFFQHLGTFLDKI